MTHTARPRARATGQLDYELRDRDTSGFQSAHLAALAALLDSIGQPVWLSGPTAAALHRFDDFRLSQPYHVTIPRGRNVNPIGHIIHTTLEMEKIDQETALGLPVLSPTRTLISLASSEPSDRLRSALEGLLRDGLTSIDHLHRRLNDLRAPGRYGIPGLLQILEAHELEGETQSWLEREYLRILRDAGVPTPASQVVLGKRRDALIRVDFSFRGTPVVVEVLGYRWHRTTAQMSIDAERVTRLTLDGKVVVQFTYEQVVKDATYVLATTQEALRPFLR